MAHFVAHHLQTPLTAVEIYETNVAGHSQECYDLVAVVLRKINSQHAVEELAQIIPIRLRLEMPMAD